MLARELIKRSLDVSLPVDAQDFEVQGVTNDSRKVAKDYIFVALPGTKRDGVEFVSDAILKGARLVITHKRITGVDVPQIVVGEKEDIRDVLARLAQVYYGVDVLLRENKISINAVTGTNGKTTSCILIQHILNGLGYKCARFGTIEYDVIKERIEASHTTPDAITLAELIRRSYENGADTIVMETSSHALVQGRCAGLEFSSATFTNLTGDHLDYHGTMEDYLEAKLLLFRSLKEDAFGIVNVDDVAGNKVLDSGKFHKISYAVRASIARLRADIKKMSAEGSIFDVYFGDSRITVKSPYIGEHNVYNLLAAIGVGLSKGASLDEISAVLNDLPVISGRLERVETDRDFQVFVDYAHTDDGLKNVLSAIKPITENRLIVVFGCGGDRDKTKRPRMARVAEDYADVIIITSDNPRTEDPNEIIEDILSGFSAELLKGDGQDRLGDRVIVEIDREIAIKRAIEMAGKGDIILIAGKGHEDYQIIGTEKIAFNDKESAMRWLARKS